MKKLLLLIVAGLFIAFTADAQEVEIAEEQVPRLVYHAFGEKYPNAIATEWSYPNCNCYEEWENKWSEELGIAGEEAPDYFFVTYKYENKDQRTVYYRTGKWVETRIKMQSKEVPENIFAFLEHTKFKDWKLENTAFFIQTALEDGGFDAYYKLTFKNKGKKETVKVDAKEGTLLSL